MSRDGLCEARCGEGLIQDSPKFADSWGKTRDDRWTMGCVADDELGLLPIPEVAQGQPQTRRWASRISTIDSSTVGYIPNGLRIPDWWREGAKRRIFLLTIIRCVPRCSIFSVLIVRCYFNNTLGCLKLGIFANFGYLHGKFRHRIFRKAKGIIACECTYGINLKIESKILLNNFIKYLFNICAYVNLYNLIMYILHLCFLHIYLFFAYSKFIDNVFK